MKLLFENWRKYQEEVENSTIVLNEERLNEIFGMPKGAVSLSDPGMGTTEEYQEKADEAWNYLQQYESEIYAAAKKQEIEPEILIGVLMDEYIRMYPRALGDIMGMMGIWDTSVGIGQTKGSTAKRISDAGLYAPPGYSSEMDTGELHRLIAGNDEIGINYTAAYIRYLDDLWGKSVWEHVPEKEKNAIILTLYSHPRGEQSRVPGSEEWETKGPPGASRRGTQAATAGKTIAQRLRHDVD